MTQVQFLADLHQGATVDVSGWSRHEVGKYILRTNGLSWIARNSETGRDAKLSIVMKAA